MWTVWKGEARRVQLTLMVYRAEVKVERNGRDLEGWTAEVMGRVKAA